MNAGPAEDRFERFNDHIRAALGSAQGEARVRRHPYVATEHLLLGIGNTSDAVAITLLAPFGLDADRMRREVETRLAGEDASAGDQLGLTVHAKRAINLAMAESLRLGDDFVGTEHLLVGLAAEGVGAAGQLLATYGAAPARIREQIVALRARPSWVREP
jgi:ATP-dependent Clp protease ATP-binding subunit ClpC